MRRWHALPQAAGWCAIAAVAFCASWLGGGQSDDEVWMLQVAARVADGEVLYRDVFFGVMPLPAWLITGLVSVFGAQLWLVKGVAAIAFTMEAAFGMRLVRQLGASKSLTALLPAGLFATALPGFATTGGVYTSLAYAFALLACSAALACGQRRRATPWLAGVALGLCLCTKQNIGVFATGLVGLMLLLGDGQVDGSALMKPARGRWRAALRLYGVALGVVGIVLLPVLWSGGLPKLLEYGFLNKTQYVALGSISYWDGFTELRRHLYDPIVFADFVAIARRGLPFLLPIAALSLLVLLGLRRRWRRAAVAGACVVATGLLGVFPRADYLHVVTAMSTTGVGLVLALSLLTASWRKGARYALVAVLFAGAGLLCAAHAKHGLFRFFQGEVTTESHPGLGPMTLAPSHHASLRRGAAALRQAASRGPLFVLSGSAAIALRMTGIHNPFPYDFPWGTALGRANGRDIIDAIEGGTLPQVCVLMPQGHPLVPAALMQYVHTRMEEEGDLGPCTLYVRPGWRAKRRRLRFEVLPYEPGEMQVYWDDGQGYREENSRRVGIDRERSHYQVALPAGPLRGLRWDPCEKRACLVEVRKVVLAEPGVPDRDLSDLSRWTPHEVMVTGHTPARVWSLGPDPWFIAPASALSP